MSNRGAWIKSAKATPLVVDEAAFPNPGPDEVVIQNAAVAVNPIDWKIQDLGIMLSKYPNILGTDVAGVVVSVGDNVSRFKPGDRVMGHALGLANALPTHGAFQLYTCCPEIVVSAIPEALSFAQAAVMPLAISTASLGLFAKSLLALPYPVKRAERTGKKLLVWGGSSSVGATAVQLAVGAGVEVLTTASSKNHETVKSLGATHVFDHTKTSVVNDIVNALSGSDFAGVYDAISSKETMKASAEIASKLGGGMVVTTLPPLQDGVPNNVKMQGMFAPVVATSEEQVGDAVWRKYVPEALADGRLQAKPDPIVIGKGLEKVQEGLEKQKAGVSFGKIVIEL